MTGVIEAIETLPRVILICRRARWAVTDQEGQDYEDLKWHDSPTLALQGLLHKRVWPTPVEEALFQEVLRHSMQNPDHAWAVEWWNREGVADSWIRPLTNGWRP